MRGLFWGLIVVAIAAGCIALMFGFVGSLTTKARLMEDTAAVEPPVRTIPIEEGRALECFTFPLRAYDDTLEHCTACEEKQQDARPQRPMMLSCR